MEHGEERILKLLLNAIPENEPVSVHKLTCISGLHHRTINKYVDLIIEIQESRKVVKQPKGMRLMIRKDAYHSNAPQMQDYGAQEMMLLKTRAR